MSSVDRVMLTVALTSLFLLVGIQSVQIRSLETRIEGLEK